MAKAKSSTFGVDVVLSALMDINCPNCPHGPAVLFERYTPSNNGNNIDQYYACSSSRDRKFCSFYMRKADKDSESKEKKLARKLYNEKLQPKFSHGQYLSKIALLKSLPAEKRQFCLDCGLALHPDEYNKHSAHNVNKIDVTDSLLTKPTQLLLPLENKKTNAQYLFAEKTTNFIVKTLKEMKYQKVLCIGAPRIHEEIQRNDSGLQSLLMDIDHRYMQFYPPDKFIRYNMFNNHIFDGEKAKKWLRSFLLEDTGSVVVVSDPPFGGLAELLSYTIQQLDEQWKETNSLDKDKCLPVLWFFPYYLESKVLLTTQGFSMLDYKVEYANHTAFKNNRTQGPSKHGSAVRIFTNINPSKFVLPKEEGYRLCKKCCRFVAKENQHCEKCNACTSKDGRTYRHCDACGRCVKPSKTHCDKCNVCDIPDRHKCEGLKITGCHICGSFEHKRKDCPKKRDSLISGKTVLQNEGHKRDHDTKKKKNSKKRKAEKEKEKSSGNVISNIVTDADNVLYKEHNVKRIRLKEGQSDGYEDATNITGKEKIVQYKTKRSLGKSKQKRKVKKKKRKMIQE